MRRLANRSNRSPTILTGRTALRPAERRSARARLAWALVAAELLHGTVSADSREARFSVSVTVPVRVDLIVLEEPDAVTLSAADIARGYKVVMARYRVVCTSRSGYLLQLIPRVGLARTIDITGLAQTVTVQRETIEVWHRSGTGADELVLQLRLELESAVGPGRYVMPLVVTAVPL